MGNLYFENRYGQRQLVEDNILQTDVHKAIKDYVCQLNPEFIICYYRMWRNPDNCKEIIYDVGSHVELFIFVEKGK